MILTVDEFRRYFQTDEEDAMLEARIQALELLIQGYTNNDFKRHLTAEGEYPMDVKMGAIQMLIWDLDNRGKVGVQSETISRHSVTYYNLDGNTSSMGYPVALLGFLKPYMRARFGQGLKR
ncbi:MAG: phage gp6-like head-tail connector protein [Oscillospiraceae bacterium]|nr:phage gp6-like head-tail connector protein [Oscillospiraceae bacterium]